MTRPSTRRAVRLVGLATAAALVVAACGSDDPDGNKEDGDAADGETEDSGSQDDASEPVEITFWSWLGGTQETVDAFNAAQDEVHVTFEQIPGGADGYNQISNAIEAGNAPEVITMEYQRLPEFVSLGTLTDLTDTAGDLVGEKFPQPIQDLVTLGDRVWSVPFDAAPLTLWYRKAWFDEHDIAVPETWDEFRTAAEEVKQADPDARITGFWYNDPTVFAGLAWQAGAQWFDISGDSWEVDVNDAASQKVADYWEQMLADDLVWLSPAWSDEFTADLVESRTVSYLSAAWGGGGLRNWVEDQSGEWAVAPMPHWGDGATGMMGGSSFAIPEGSENVDAALTFIEWATTTPEGIEARLGSGSSSAVPAVPELRDVAADAFDTTFYGGQDIYSVTGPAVETINTNWDFGPVWGDLMSTLQDAASTMPDGGTLAEALVAGDESARTEIQSRGLSLASQ